MTSKRKTSFAKYFAVLSGIMFLFSCHHEELKTISTSSYADKVAGGWAGKMIGVMYGAPFEFVYVDSIYEGEISWDPESVKGALNNDDLYVQLGFMGVIDSFGIDCHARHFAEQLANAKFEVCHANRMARRNYLKGIMPPVSGSPRENMHADDIDFQIESDFIGYINPGMPLSSNSLCNTIGHVMCYGDGVYGGMYVAALNSLAFFENNIDTLVCNSLKAIPEESKYAQCVRDVIAGYKADPDDWRSTWDAVTKKWGKTDICVPNHSFNIDAKLNGAYIVLALLYGKGDFEKTMEIAARCGQDSDCNASNAAGVLGVIYGYKGIDERWKKVIPSIANDTFSYTSYTFNKAVEQSLVYARLNTVNNGGKTTETELKIKIQKPKHLFPAEVSFPDISYSYETNVTQPDWQFKGTWSDYIIGRGDNEIFKCTSTAGNVCEMTFSGKGIMLQGYCNTDGGKADVFIDDRFIRTIDFYYPFEAGIYLGNRAHLFHILTLDDKKHTLRLVSGGDKNPLSKGNKVWVERAIIYK